ncbi:MAG: YfhO family protein [Thermomicrobiales bacterium]|nr:YfhO family protein [Thermomicrobiales bacterium]
MPRTRPSRSADAAALTMLALLVGIVAWNRLAFDVWLTRLDLFTFFLPWYALLGERLRDLAIPGWNSHLFSGAPLAGDPESGWMYLPAMLLFTVIPSAIAAFKGMVVTQLTVAALSTYALARALGMGAFASLVAAVVYLTGPFLTWNTNCCLVFVQFATWLPLALLGVELALRAPRWRDRLVPWGLGGLGVSQMLGGWIGEGWLYAILIPAAYIGYRALLSPPEVFSSDPAPGVVPHPQPLSQRSGRGERVRESRWWKRLPSPTGVGRVPFGWRLGVRDDAGRQLLYISGNPITTPLLVGAATGIAILGLGLALGAAGLLPRLAVNPETNLAGGDYAKLGHAGVLNPPWQLDYLLRQTLGAGSGYHFRAASFGGVAAVLSLLAIPLAGRRFAAPFFLALTLVAMILTLETTPLHLLFYLIPRYREFHDHDAWRTIAFVAIGPAVLSGAAIEALPRWRGRWRLLPVVAVPLVLMAIVTVTISHAQTFLGWSPLIAAAIATALIALTLVIPRIPRPGSLADAVARAVPPLLLVVAFVLPTGLELTGSWLGWPHSALWDERWRKDPATTAALEANMRRDDPGGAGELLQRAYASEGPFRYVGYGGVGYPGDEQRRENYMARRFDPAITALLVNGRPMLLGLEEIQGYDPLQLSRYVEFMDALNGATQDYHTAYLLPSGAGSPLLDLLDLRYVLVDATLPTDREDIRALAAGRHEVFRTPEVIVYERDIPPRRAWIVHDARQVTRGEALPLLTSGAVDPFRTALVEGPLPELGRPAANAEGSAEIVAHHPGALTIATHSGAPGMLVVSEIVSNGWQATVDGQPTPILPADHALQAIPLPAGEHVVELRYAPASLRIGLLISGIAALAVLAVFIAAAWRRRSRGEYPAQAPSGANWRN